MGGVAVIGQIVNTRTDETYEIAASPTPVGRHRANAVVLKGFAVSRFHAELGEIEPGKPYIEDMGSTYGTYVNGHKIEGRVRLHHGDEIVLGVSGGFPDGEYVFKFVQAEGGAEEDRATKAPTRQPIREGTTEFADAPEAYVFRLSGVFRRNECDSLVSDVVGRVRARPKNVVLELSRVEYLNSYGLGCFVRLSQDVTGESKHVALAGAQGLVLRLLETVGLDRKLGNFPSEEAATSSFKKA